MQFRRRGVYNPPESKHVIPPADFDLFFNSFIDSTKKQWAHDRTKTLGGSEVFGCIRKAWYSRHETPKDPDYKESWGATRRGDLIENYHVVPAMQHAAETGGFKIDYVGGDQQTLFCDGVPMSVTPDGLIHGLPRNWLQRYGIPDIKSDCVMFEIKSIDPRVDLSEEKAIHHGQTQIQMGLVRENTKFRPHYAVILYVNASFFDDMNVFVVEWDEKKYEVAKLRARTAYEAPNAENLIREGQIDGSCTYCPFKGACLATTLKAFPKDEEGKGKKAKQSPQEHVDAVADLVALAHKARIAKKKAEKTDALIKEQIKGKLTELQTRRVKDGEWSLSYSMQSGRATIDKDKMSTVLRLTQDFIDKHNLGTEFDNALREAEIVPAEQNETARIDNPDIMMKVGDPYDVLRLVFTEPDAEEL